LLARSNGHYHHKSLSPTQNSAQSLLSGYFKWCPITRLTTLKPSASTISSSQLYLTSFQPHHVISSEREAIDHIEDFVPKKKVLVQINKTNLYVYPNATPEMGDNEGSLAFNINKTALVNARSISFNQKLNHMGELLGCSNIIDIERTVYKNAAFDFLKINTNLIPLSYHNT
jgi:hypothetical protein